LCYQLLSLLLHTSQNPKFISYSKFYYLWRR
jgi:hypothetical protein